ncbi:hypothetical protein [Rheinheimera sp.]|uniref:hypothetical protein n=1 Tax=Rheinheimera sp. TaxID=1869214 RepID=UPI00307D7FCF
MNNPGKTVVHELKSHLHDYAKGTCDDLKVLNLLVILFETQDYGFAQSHSISPTLQEEYHHLFKKIYADYRFTSESSSAEAQFWFAYYSFFHEGKDISSRELDEIGQKTNITALLIEANKATNTEIERIHSLYTACQSEQSERERYIVSVLRGIAATSKGKIAL